MSFANPDRPIKIGISSCLLGCKVRFDAGHKRDRYITDMLGRYFEFVEVCPELEVGMGVPREAVRLEGEIDNPRMVGNKSGEDWTERMNRYAQRRVRQADFDDLCGFILKNRSPSCGMERVKVYTGTGSAERKGVGLFARALLASNPELPVEEEGRLEDAALRDNFIVRVFAYHRLQELFRQPFRRRDMIAFHAAHKYLLLAHSPKHYNELGRLVADLKTYRASEFRALYRTRFMSALSVRSTPRKNVNVLQHIAGFLKHQLRPPEKEDVHAAIKDYHAGLVPLVVPITLIRHFVKKYAVEYVLGQVYLEPHPRELMLRNHV